MANYKVNMEAVDAMKMYVKKSEDYGIINILAQNNLLNSHTDKGLGQHVLSCPFHSDSNPSFNVNDENNVWSCFSCGAGGNALSLLFDINQKINGSSAGYYQFLNSLLVSDLKMKTTIKFLSIYKSDSDFRSAGPYVRKQFIPSDEKSVRTYLQLSHEMKKQNLVAIEQIRLSILYAQMEMGPEEILKHLKGIKTEVLEEGTESFFDITDLLGSGG